MSDIVIKAENISKQYRLGEVSTGTLTHDLNVFWHRIRGRENPYLKIGESNDRTTVGTSEYVWALKDIEFEVKRGEVLGIIGRNGAGKSTLLKILSKTTAPTTGRVLMKGRVASLLEVGTGFHPDLSGRDNIFLNGAILGMTKKEITRKFDEIVDFAGVERYINTPVKRYSSGMYVRLAFAVAAHLEPEILIVDEVLAVGDAEFQKKCLGKMKDVAGQGRTVLFVSHNMSAINNLCEKIIVLGNGRIHFEGNTSKGIDFYLEENMKNKDLDNPVILETSNDNKSVKIYKIGIKNSSGQYVNKFEFNETVEIEFWLDVKHAGKNYFAGVNINNIRGECLFSTNDIDMSESYLNMKSGIVKYSFSIPSKLLKPGIYNLDFAAATRANDGLFDWHSGCKFEIVDHYSKRAEKNLYWTNALIAPEIKWEIENNHE
jgi:lipopolysaccharide transport system ATP-binding protein